MVIEERVGLSSAGGAPPAAGLAHPWLGRFAAAVTGRWGRWVVLALWLLGAGLLTAVAPKVADLYDNDATSAIGDQESVRAARLLNDAFPDQRGLPAIVVVHRPGGLTAADEAVARQISDWLATGPRPAEIGPVVSPYTIPQARSQLVSPDNTTLTIVAALTSSPNDERFSAVVEAIRAFTDPLDGRDGLQVKVTGPAGVLADAVAIFASTDLPLLLTTVGLVLVLLLIIYRSPILALVPLVAVGVALQVVDALLGFAARAGIFGVSQQATSIMTILLFGAGTDYTIFLASRYREELRQEPDRIAALRRALVGVGEAIASSAGTVIAALLTLLLTTLGLYFALGPTLAIAVAVMLLAGLTFVPAILAILGRFAFWPFAPQAATADQAAGDEPAEGRGLWGRLAGWVTRRPLAAVVGSVVLLAILAAGNIGTVEVFNFLTGFRKPTPSAAGYRLLAAHFPPGTLAPFDVVIQLPPGANAYEHLAAIEDVTAAVARVPNVAKVTGPTRPDGAPPAIAPAELQRAIAQLPPALTEAIRAGQVAPTGAGGASAGMNPQVVGLYAASSQYVARQGDVVRLQVTLASDPYGVPALDTMTPLRATARHTVEEAFGDGASVLLAGVTPQQADTRTVSDRDTRLVVPLVLLLVGLILALLLRSLVAPLYLLLAVTLNFFAALGASAFLFTRLQGDEGVAYAIPLYSFIFLVALGADYTIFLMARVREEAAVRGLLAGTRVALGRTGGVITSAGLILAGTFLVLTTLPLRELYQLGVVVALGVLLDTFVVRGLLVPGLVVLLGRANWWPGRLREG